MLRSFQSRNQRLLLVKAQSVIKGLRVATQAVLTKNCLSQRKGWCEAVGVEDKVLREKSAPESQTEWGILRNTCD